MLIEGPFKFGVIENPNSPGYEIHLEFTPAFRELNQEQQYSSLKEYLQRLQKEILAAPEHSDDRQGMLMVQQVAEQLLPMVGAGQLPLNETIIVEVQRGSSLSRFIPDQDSIN
jgi:hypothetical protein